MSTFFQVCDTAGYFFCEDKNINLLKLKDTLESTFWTKNDKLRIVLKNPLDNQQQLKQFIDEQGLVLKKRETPF